MRSQWWLPLALCPLWGLASTLIPHTLEDRLKESDRVAVVQVLSRRTIAENGDPARLKTLTELVVGRDVKGGGEQRLTLVQLGGTLGLNETRIAGDATFAPGETAVVFLKCRAATRCTLVALGEGKVPVVGGDALVHDMFKDRWSRLKLDDLVLRLQKAAQAGAPR